MKILAVIPLSIIFLCVQSSFVKSSKSVPISYDSTVHYPVSCLLPLYFSLKNALVNSDASVASEKANALMTALNGIDKSSLSSAELKVFISLQSKLIYDARHIAEVKKIEHQREHFVNLSINMYALAKSVRLSSQPVYQDYCPMRKAYWLSADKAIKNPYYGSEMPDCGDVVNSF